MYNCIIAYLLLTNIDVQQLSEVTFTIVNLISCSKRIAKILSRPKTVEVSGLYTLIKIFKLLRTTDDLSFKYFI